ncbi:squalene/phytoene synthase family protein [Roseovarius sp. SCSIO 43702]|uniref:squalene/phytoene synthase family protein n=1 Tax=Roseovarius sp. SCSIO 43702 TaxID=2823043 RepID=UPI001C73A103|nr:squalene/phytoene synthase family protein [Roseovarius sp. SCSIO 43702]QYX57411.1 squalene/phytoene synthase family protein [Roseovarius sp. SCSIO 43702]
MSGEFGADAALDACGDIVRRGDPERFRAAMAVPVPARRVLFPIYAMNVEVARAPWVTAESMIAEMRLQWWRDALKEIADGGQVRRHEVATPLSGVLDRESATELDELVLARRWDIYREPFEDEAAFRRHLDHTAGHLLRAAVRSLGGEAGQAVRDAGFAQGVAAWFRAVPALEAAGRIPLVDGREGAVRALAEEGLERLTAARRAGVAPAARPAMVALWQVEGVLRRAARHPARVKDGTLAPAPVADQLGLMATALSGRW